MVKSIKSPSRSGDMYSSKNKLIEEEIDLDRLDEDIQSLGKDDDYEDDDDDVCHRKSKDTVTFLNEKATTPVKKVSVDVHNEFESDNLSDSKIKTLKDETENVQEEASPKKHPETDENQSPDKKSTEIEFQKDEPKSEEGESKPPHIEDEVQKSELIIPTADNTPREDEQKYSLTNSLKRKKLQIKAQKEKFLNMVNREGTPKKTKFPMAIARAFKKQLSKEKSESKETLLKSESKEEVELKTIPKPESPTEENSENVISKPKSAESPSRQEVKEEGEENEILEENNEEVNDNESIESKSSEETERVINTKQLHLIGIYVHECSKLMKHGFLNSPIVKISFFDMKTEKEIKTRSKMKITTKPYSICLHSTISPEWNELVLLENELMNSLASIKQFVILFDVMDKSEVAPKDSYPRPLALAFIKPFATENMSNINKKLKLQLFEHPNLDNPDAVYRWWKSNNRILYPGFLKITLRVIFKDEALQNINRIKTAMIENSLKIRITRQSSAPVRPASGQNDYNLLERHKTSHCKIPNRLTKCIYNSEKGSSVIRFSSCGKFLASTAVVEKKYYIIIYSTPTFKETAKLTGHTNIIYDLCWSTNTLASASADYSICLWRIDEVNHYMIQKIVQSQFIYAVKVCSHNPSVLVTGGYDKVVRVWLNNNENTDNVDYRLHQELDGHDGFINSITFGSSTETFYTADSCGLILKWSCDEGSWYNVQKIVIKEFKDNIINDIQMFPNGRRMLVVLRHSVSWNLDLMTQTAFTCYKDNDSCRYLTRGRISPCSTIIFIRNKVYDSATGKILASYDPPVYDSNPIIAVDYNSTHHVFAISSYTRNAPLLICHYDETLEIDAELGLDLFTSIPTKTKLLPLPKIEMPKIQDKPPAISPDLSGNLPDANNLKLWDLIVKMDCILTNAKQGKKKLETNGHYEKPLLTGDIKTIETEIIDKLSQAKENSESGGTYNVKESKFVMQVDENSPKRAAAAFDDSSTLSQAESLEDDCQTYSIHLDK